MQLIVIDCDKLASGVLWHMYVILYTYVSRILRAAFVTYVVFYRIRCLKLPITSNSYLVQKIVRLVFNKDDNEELPYQFVACNAV